MGRDLVEAWEALGEVEVRVAKVEEALSKARSQASAMREEVQVAKAWTSKAMAKAV